MGRLILLLTAWLPALVWSGTDGPCRREDASLLCSQLTDPEQQLCPHLNDSLRSVHVQHSALDNLPPYCFANASALSNLSLEYCGLERLNGTFLPDSLRRLNLTGNKIRSLESLGKLPNNIAHLSLRENPVASIGRQPLRSLLSLDLRGSELRWLNLTQLKATFPRLRRLDLSSSKRLESLVGRLPKSLTELDLSSCDLEGLPRAAFQAAKASVDVSNNPLHCGRCRLRWRWEDSASIQWTNTNATLCRFPDAVNGKRLAEVPGLIEDDCDDVRVDSEGRQVFEGVYKGEAILRCPISPLPGGEAVVWSTGGERIGSWDSEGWAEREWRVGGAEKEAWQKGQLLPSGGLLLSDLRAESVRWYTCEGGGANATVALRLDYYSVWTIRVYIYSLFCGVATALGFFALNIIWAGIRSVVMWRLRRVEETSRLRKMLEALEKYRQRQLEVLHEEYESRMAAIRDNYAAQSERLRQSYSHFSSYGAASLDSLQQTYGAQMTRLRDYGGRQTERLWESYQRQLNRIRTFSLHQRLRLARQYKLRHSHLNSLLESLNLDTSMGSSIPQPPSASPLHPPTLPTLHELDEVEEPSSLYSSYHSLPPSSPLSSGPPSPTLTPHPSPLPSLTTKL